MGHGHDHHEIDINNIKKFSFDASARKLVFGLIGGGAVMLILGLLIAIMTEGKGGHDAGGGAHHSSVQPAAVTYKLTTLNPQDDHATNSHDEFKNSHSGDAKAKDGEAKAAETHEKAPADAHKAESDGAHGGGHGSPGGHHDAHGSAAHEHHEEPLHGPAWLIRLFSNLLINSFMFTAIGGAAIFFLAVKNVSNAGWYTSFKRVPEAMGHFIYIGAGLLLVTFLAGSGMLYEWTNPEVVANDPLGILPQKTPYLNKPFFLIRNILYFGMWILFLRQMVKYSKMEDESRSIEWFNKRVALSALFIVLFALSFSSATWDWMMSVEAHWFSTMFSVHSFASAWAAALATMTLIIIYLHDRGYMPHINLHHFHDLARFVFGFSIFWTYIWFCEFLLIWYANIPEEGAYFFKRLEHYPVMFFANFIINFIVPFLVLMSRANNRHIAVLGGISAIVVFGHWIDFYLMVMPGTMRSFGGFGLMEIGMFVMFFGLFMFVTARVLEGMNIIPKNDPYLEESLHHEIVQ